MKKGFKSVLIGLIILSMNVFGTTFSTKDIGKKIELNLIKGFHLSTGGVTPNAWIPEGRVPKNIWENILDNDINKRELDYRIFLSDFLIVTDNFNGSLDIGSLEDGEITYKSISDIIYEYWNKLVTRDKKTLLFTYNDVVGKPLTKEIYLRLGGVYENINFIKHYVRPVEIVFLSEITLDDYGNKTIDLDKTALYLYKEKFIENDDNIYTTYTGVDAITVLGIYIENCINLYSK